MRIKLLLQPTNYLRLDPMALFPERRPVEPPPIVQITFNNLNSQETM